MKVKLTYLGNAVDGDVSDCVVGPGPSTIFPVGKPVSVDTEDPDYRGAPEAWLRPLLTNQFFKVETEPEPKAAAKPSSKV